MKRAIFVRSKMTIMAELEKRAREKGIYKVTLWGSFANFLLVIFKFLAGIAGHSAAMMADAVHSLSDFVTDVVVILFVRISNKPQDKGHDYGHGKYETLATALIGVALLGVGCGILWNGAGEILAFMRGEQLRAPGVLALIAALVSILLKEILYQYTVRMGRKYNSQAVIANAWHHRSDALSSIGTASGIGGAILLGPHWVVLDPIAAVIVSFFIMKVSVTFNRKDISIFAGQLNKKVCNEHINVVDDGTIPFNRGSVNFDDEGVEGQKTYIVKEGVLTSYLHDRISAKHYGVNPTGNGRRDTFRNLPIPRMRATYMEAGNMKEADIISTVKNGIFVDTFTNGQVQIGAGDFTFFVKSGYLIEDGKLTQPIKDINIIGNGPKALADITMVADNDKIDNGTWTCGKDGQSCPVTCGMPSALVSKLTVGGEN